MIPWLRRAALVAVVLVSYSTAFGQERYDVVIHSGRVIDGTGNPFFYYGIFPRVIRKFVFEERLLTLEDAIRKMTSLPASVMRLKDQGLLREGYRADVTIFDPVTIRQRSTYVRPHVYSEGVRYVLVNGAFAVDGGEVTGELGGEVLTPEG